MKCVRCRRDNEPAGTFCRYCGERMPARPAAGVAARRRLIVIVAAVVAVALVIACVLVYRRYDEARTTRRLLNGVSGTYISAYDPDRYGYTLLTFALDGDGRITGWDSEGEWFTGQCIAYEYDGANGFGVRCWDMDVPDDVNMLFDHSTMSFYPLGTSLDDVSSNVLNGLVPWATAGGVDGNVLAFPLLADNAVSHPFARISEDTTAPSRLITDPFAVAG